MTARTTMFYDGGCPLCMRGVRHYQRLDWARRLAWVDITREPERLASHGVHFATAMESLHVLTRDGELVSGFPAFVAIWCELPGYRHLARLRFVPGLVKAVDLVYRRLTRGRYAGRCGEHACLGRLADGAEHE